METVLQSTCAGYEWEAMMVSPHLHCGVPVARERVFYVGIRSDA